MADITEKAAPWEAAWPVRSVYSTMKSVMIVLERGGPKADQGLVGASRAAEVWP